METNPTTEGGNATHPAGPGVWDPTGPVIPLALLQRKGTAGFSWMKAEWLCANADVSRLRRSGVRRLLVWHMEVCTPVTAAPAHRLDIKEQHRASHNVQMRPVSFTTAPQTKICKGITPLRVLNGVVT